MLPRRHLNSFLAIHFEISKKKKLRSVYHRRKSDELYIVSLTPVTGQVRFSGAQSYGVHYSLRAVQPQFNAKPPVCLGALWPTKKLSIPCPADGDQ